MDEADSEGCTAEQGLMRANFFLSQALTGHGSFGDYLSKIGKTASSECTCRLKRQTPKHVFTKCPRYKEGRPRDLVWNEDTRWYLISTMRKLWHEEQSRQTTTAAPKSITNHKKEKKTKKRKKKRKK